MSPPYHRMLHNCSCLESIISECDVPPMADTIAFATFPTMIPVHIPMCSLTRYQAAIGWNQFENFQEDSFYQLTVSPDADEHGTVSIIQQPDCELDAIVLAEPCDGYVFEGWIEDGAMISSENPYMFTLTSDRNIVACFCYTGVDDNNMVGVSVYPNPISDVVSISGENLRQIEINDNFGRCVVTHQAEGLETMIDISNQPGGIYFISITDEKGKRCVRTVVKE